MRKFEIIDQSGCIVVRLGRNNLYFKCTKDRDGFIKKVEGSLEMENALKMPVSLGSGYTEQIKEAYDFLTGDQPLTGSYCRYYSKA